MYEVLERYEYLMVYRLMDGRGLETDDVRDLLDGYYKLRKAVEEGERIATTVCALVRNGRTEESGRQIAAPTEGERIAAPACAPARNDSPANERAEQEPPKMTGQGAKLKNTALDLYDRLRRAGVTRAEILEAGAGSFGETELDLMVNRRKVDFAFWQAFHDTLETLVLQV